MPYDKPSDAPDYVPEDKKKQWIAVWNSAYDKAKKEGKSDKDAEESAFAQANGVAGPNKKTHYDIGRHAYPLLKVDSINRTVTGVITSETPDKVGEICDYESSKPYYQAWSQEFAKATGGISLGNLREMHDLSAVGKFTDIIYDDDNKVITGTSKVVDNNAWEKCEQGVYTGFSHGGDYVGGFKKEGDYKRYTAKPSEVSLVDNPANPDAHFEFIRTDGTVEMRKFASTASKPEDSPVTKTPEPITTSQSKPSPAVPIEVTEYIKSTIESILNERLKKDSDICPVCGNPISGCTCGDPKKPSEVRVKEMKSNDEADDELDKGKTSDKKPYGDVEYADPGYQKDKKKRYPLDTETHIRAAWNYISKKKNASKYSTDEVDKIKAKVIAAWKDKIDKDGPPSAEKVAIVATTALASALQKRYRLTNQEVERVLDYDLKKGLNHLTRLANLLLDMAWLQWSVTQEQKIEGDEGSTLSDDLRENLADVADSLIQMANEETEELIESARQGEMPDEVSLRPYDYCSSSPLYCAMGGHDNNGLTSDDDTLFRAMGIANEIGKVLREEIGFEFQTLDDPDTLFRVSY